MSQKFWEKIEHHDRKTKKYQNIPGLLFIMLGLLGCLLITIFITIPYIINPLLENLFDEFFKDKIEGGIK